LPAFRLLVELEVCQLCNYPRSFFRTYKSPHPWKECGLESCFERGLRW